MERFALMYYMYYAVKTVVLKLTNVYGPRERWLEGPFNAPYSYQKVVPTFVVNALLNKPLPIYGDGKNIRDWLYVLDHCKGIDLVYHTGKTGEVYNIGGRNERDNNYIANKICEILDDLSPKESGKSHTEQITYVEDRAGHDRRYAIDATKIEGELGWKADENFDSGIFKTVKWYLDKYKNKRNIDDTIQ